MQVIALQNAQASFILKWAIVANEVFSKKLGTLSRFLPLSLSNLLLSLSNLLHATREGRV
jgi:hypothetical protein